MSNILTIDASECATGYAVVYADSSRAVEEVLAHGCIVTKPATTRASKTHDDIRRCSEIAATLRDVVNEYHPALIVAELPTGSQRASGAKAMGMVLGIMGSLRALLGIPCEWVTPQAVKKASAGVLNASKDDVQRAVLRVWDDLDFDTKVEREAVCDAMGALMAAREGDLYLMAALPEATKAGAA